MSKAHPTDQELLSWYDEVFDHRVDDAHARPGVAHIRALRVVYEKGFENGKAA